MTVKTGREFYSTGWAYIAQGERFLKKSVDRQNRVKIIKLRMGAKI